jgi:threonine dehydratase
VVTLEIIEQAGKRITPYIVHTPFHPCFALGKLCDKKIWCKFENHQTTGSFKDRGAVNKLLQLSPEEKRHGIVAASAGNHAQGVAHFAHLFGIPATVVMPVYTPLVKVKNTQETGARVILYGTVFDESMEYARSIARQENKCLIHAFDDPLIIAGQGTVALEILAEDQPLDTIIVPIGGGGLISGIGTVIKSIHPDLQVIGVESELFPGMSQALSGKEIIPLQRTIADGIAVKRPSKLTLDLVRKYVDEIYTVNDDYIARAVMLFLELEKTLVEGAGAVGLAALLEYGENIPGKKCALVVSGGNMDTAMLARVIEKGLIQEGRLARLTVRASDNPGALAAITTCISRMEANIIEVEHDRGFSSPISMVDIELTIETRSKEHIENIVASLVRAGYQIVPDKNRSL